MVTQVYEGFLVVNKPKDYSSFDCVRHIQRLAKNAGIKKLKIGHTGTLDEFAQGIMILCIGRPATKQVRHLMEVKKRYNVVAKFGELTDTLDYTGKVVEEQESVMCSREVVTAALQSLAPAYIQVPPIFSALKFQGKPLYALARGKKLNDVSLHKIVEAKKREVFIYDFDVQQVEMPWVRFSVLVSKGTYIRSLAQDIAQKCGTYATVYELVRSQVGGVTLADAHSLDELQNFADVEQRLIAINTFFDRVYQTV